MMDGFAKETHVCLTEIGGEEVGVLLLLDEDQRLLRRRCLSTRRLKEGRVSSGHGSDRSASPKIVTGSKILTVI